MKFTRTQTSRTTSRQVGDAISSFSTDALADKLLAAAGHPATDDFVRHYVCRYLSFRYFAFENLTVKEQQAARRLEAHIRDGHTTMGKPLLNPR